MNEFEKNSPLWRMLKQTATERLDGLRRQMESEQSHDTTNVLRGRIRELRWLLALEDSND